MDDRAKVKKDIRITPRARRKAAELGIDTGDLDGVPSGYEGGFCEADILRWYADRKRDAVHERDTGHHTDAVHEWDIGHHPDSVHERDADHKPETGARKPPITPLAARIAAAMEVDLERMKGTGSGGKITAEDVRGAAGRACAERTLPYEGIRRIIGEKLSASASSAPHICFMQKVDMHNLLEIRSGVNRAGHVRSSVTDYLIRACVLSLEKYPDINVSLQAGRIALYREINIGVAVAAPGGLIVPVIKGAQRLNLAGISAATSALIDQAKAGRLKPEDYSGGTFTLSNLGMYGVERFTAIINPPESAILAVGAIRDEVRPILGADGQKTMGIRPVMDLTLSADHRVIDGALAAQFIVEIKKQLEFPIALMMDTGG